MAYRISAVSTFIIAVAWWPGFAVASAYAAEKTIEVEHQFAVEPVTITRVTYQNLEVQFGKPLSRVAFDAVTPFEAGDDWLQSTTLYLLNRTNKTIAYGDMTMRFPETGDGSAARPMYAYEIRFGRIPPPAAFTGSGQPLRNPGGPPVSFAPGQTMTINLGGLTPPIGGTLVSIPFSAVTKCIIHMLVFYFDDGMMWKWGGFYLPDPNAPGKWNRVVVPGGYFPGHMWPWPPQ